MWRDGEAEADIAVLVCANAESLTMRFQPKQQRRRYSSYHAKRVLPLLSVPAPASAPASAKSEQISVAGAVSIVLWKKGTIGEAGRKELFSRRRQTCAKWQCADDAYRLRDSDESYYTFIRRAAPRPPPIRTCIAHCADRRAHVDAVASRLAMPPIVMTGLH